MKPRGYPRETARVYLWSSSSVQTNVTDVTEFISLPFAQLSLVNVTWLAFKIGV